MARNNKVQELSTSSSQPSSTFDNAQNDLEDEEEQHKAYMLKEFGKEGFKKIKKFMEKLEKKRECLDRQEYLLILEKERKLASEKALVEEKMMVEKLAIYLSLVNDSNERMSKENTLINESLASLKATHSELQESFSCLTTKYNGLEVSYNALWESTKTNSKATLDSNIFTSEGCSKCYKIDVQTCVTNMAKLEKLIQEKDVKLERMNKLVKHRYEGNVKPKPKVSYKDGRYPNKNDGLGHYKGEKVNDRKVVKGKECVMFTKGANLEDLMNISQCEVKNKVEAPIKVKVPKHEPSPSYTTDYMVIMDHNGKIVVKYVGPL
jgi:hypothetical protein